MYTTWVDDPAEVSMRVWAFWRQWLIDGAGQLTYWNVALRLVVLVQPSSASAELMNGDYRSTRLRLRGEGKTTLTFITHTHPHEEREPPSHTYSTVLSGHSPDGPDQVTEATD